MVAADGTHSDEPPDFEAPGEHPVVARLIELLEATAGDDPQLGDEALTEIEDALVNCPNEAAYREAQQALELLLVGIGVELDEMPAIGDQIDALLQRAAKKVAAARLDGSQERLDRSQQQARKMRAEAGPGGGPGALKMPAGGRRAAPQIGSRVVPGEDPRTSRNERTKRAPCAGSCDRGPECDYYEQRVWVTTRITPPTRSRPLFWSWWLAIPGRSRPTRRAC